MIDKNKLLLVSVILLLGQLLILVRGGRSSLFPPKPITSIAPSFSPQQVQEILTAHNKYRTAVRVPPLLWSEELAESAKAWADTLAKTGELRHSKREGVGENLAASSAWKSLGSFVDLWGAEQRYFIPSVFPNTSRTGNWTDAGHYTQLVWRKTTEVGCGLAATNGGRFRYIFVCQYQPAGNVVGEGVF